MKLGSCLNLLPKTGSGIGIEHAAALGELGYDYLELPLAQAMELPEPDFLQMITQLGSLGIPVEACNNFFPASLRLTGDAANLPTALRYARRAFDRAAKMGAKVVVLGSSGAKNIPADFPYARALEQLTELLHSLQGIARLLDITVALEPINTVESNFICSVDEGLSVVKSVDGTHIRLLADYYHMRVENEGLDALVRASTKLCHLHMASKETRALPRQGDGEDYAAFFAALKAAGYNARVSLEGHCEDIYADGKAALEVLRPFLSA